MAGQGVIEGARKAVHVREEGFPLTIHLFRCDVVRSPPYGGVKILLLIRIGRETKVDQLGIVLMVEQDVGWFEIPVQQVVGQGRIQSRRHLDPHVQNEEFLQGSMVFNAAIQTAIVCNLHDQVAHILQFIKGIDVNDVRMIQASTGASFAVKTLHNLLVICQFRLHELDGNFPLQSGIKGPIDHTHATFCNGSEQLELTKHHGHHDGMLTFRTWSGAHGLQVPGYENLGSTTTAGDHLERLFCFERIFGHNS